MSRYAGMVETRKVDRLLTSQELDREQRHALTRFQEQIDHTVLRANQEVLSKRLPRLSTESITKLAVRVAELRASYLAAALDLADQPGTPSVESVEALQRKRMAFDELREAFEALERVIERGYANFV